MFFDTTIQAFTMDVVPIPDEHHLILQFQSGIVIPGPAGPDGRQRGQGLLPVGAIKIPVAYNLAKEFAQELQEALNNMTPPSKLQVVSNSHAAEAAAANVSAIEKQIREGPIAESQ